MGREQVEPLNKAGSGLPDAVRLSLLSDHGVVLSLEEIENKVFTFSNNHSQQYSAWTVGTGEDLKKEVANFFKSSQSNPLYMDIIAEIISMSLDIKLVIIRESSSSKVQYAFNTGKGMKQVWVHLDASGKKAEYTSLVLRTGFSGNKKKLFEEERKKKHPPRRVREEGDHLSPDLYVTDSEGKITCFSTPGGEKNPITVQGLPDRQPMKSRKVLFQKTEDESDDSMQTLPSLDCSPHSSTSSSMHNFTEEELVHAMTKAKQARSFKQKKGFLDFIMPKKTPWQGKEETDEVVDLVTPEKAEGPCIQQDMSSDAEDIQVVKSSPQEVKLESSLTSSVHDVFEISSDDDFDISGSQQSVGSTTSNSSLPPVGLSFNEPFPFHQFGGLKEEIVERCPHDIDGKAVFSMPATTSTYALLANDGRHWDMKTTSNRNIFGTCKVGWCQGTFECRNEDCGFLQETGLPNRHAFTNKRREDRDALKICKTCHHIAGKKFCGARKYTMFKKDLGILKIYHLGTHKCHLKPNAKQVKEERKQALEKMHKREAPREVQRMMIEKALKEEDEEGRMNVDGAIREAILWSDTKAVANLQAQMSNSETACDKNSLDAVCHLKTKSDKTDKFLIYRVQNGAGCNKTTFVFKTSQWCAEIGLKMDVDAEPNPYNQEAVCFFDVSMKRLQGGYKALALWTFHPITHRIIRLCSMDILRESTEDLVCCFSLWNEVLSTVNRVPGYKFNPKTFICDEAGGNHQALKKIYDIEGDGEKVHTCLMHFKQNVLKKRPFVPAEDKKKFDELTQELANVATVAEYKRIRQELITLAGSNVHLKSWIPWWDARRSHLFTAFRGTGYSGSNLAEVGNAAWTRGRQLSLVDAAYDDISTVIAQEQDVKAYLRGDHKQTGAAPSQMQQAARDRRFQLKRSHEYGENLSTEALLQQAEEIANPTRFIPGDKSRHRPPKKTAYSIEGEGDHHEEDEEDGQQRKRKGKGKGIGKSSRGKGTGTQDPANKDKGTKKKQSTHQRRDKFDTDEEDMGEEFENQNEDQNEDPMEDRRKSKASKDKGRRKGAQRGGKKGRPTSTRDQSQTKSPRTPGGGRREPEEPKEWELEEKIEELKDYLPLSTNDAIQPRSQRRDELPQNSPKITFGASNVKRCQGCHGLITAQEKARSCGMVFEQMGFSNWTNIHGQTFTQWKKNYMHLKGKCLTDFNSNNEIKHITMTNTTLMRVQEEEAAVLVEKGFLIYILANKL